MQQPACHAGCLFSYRVRVPITTDLLARLKSLDDLHELVHELGYTPASDELTAAARARLGLAGDGPGVTRAAIVARHGAFVVYGATFARPGRHEVVQAVERLARATPGERNLLFALDAQGTTLTAAAVAPSVTGFRAR